MYSCMNDLCSPFYVTEPSFIGTVNTTLAIHCILQHHTVLIILINAGHDNMPFVCVGDVFSSQYDAGASIALQALEWRWSGLKFNSSVTSSVLVSIKPIRLSRNLTWHQELNLTSVKKGVKIISSVTLMTFAPPASYCDLEFTAAVLISNSWTSDIFRSEVGFV